jgi:hypothetical protein
LTYADGEPDVRVAIEQSFAGLDQTDYALLRAIRESVPGAEHAHASR